MRGFYVKRRFALYFALALVTVSTMTLTNTVKPQHVVAQSGMDMMEMMRGGSNKTGNTTMMLDDNNMSKPFSMGVVVMPMMCTTPNQLLGSLGGMFGPAGMSGDDGNATQQMMMEMMSQQMNMSGVGMGMQNMSESDMQQAMNFQICFPTMGEEMMQHMQDMMGNGQNSTGSMVSGMMDG